MTGFSKLNPHIFRRYIYKILSFVLDNTSGLWSIQSKVNDGSFGALESDLKQEIRDYLASGKPLEMNAPDLQGKREYSKTLLSLAITEAEANGINNNPTFDNLVSQTAFALLVYKDGQQVDINLGAQKNTIDLKP